MAAPRLGHRGALAVSALLRGALALPRPLLRPMAGPVIRSEDGTVEMPASARAVMRLIRKQMPTSLDQLGRLRADSERGGPILSGRVGRTLRVTDLTVPGAEGPVRARLYEPGGAAAEPGPLLVFFHGGGWVLGGVESHDPVCLFLAERAGVRVLSCEYRLAPEHPFPAQFEDALAAYRHVVGDPARFGAEQGRIAVGGDSAGGNLAAAVAHAALRGEAAVPAWTLLIYPATDVAGEYASRRVYGKGFVIDTETWTGPGGLIASMMPHAEDPRMSVLRDPDVAGLPPTYIATGGFDPLRDEGEAYGERLREAGVEVTVRRFAELFHGFASFGCVERTSGAAMAEIADAVRGALLAAPTPQT
ncbi:alpha/beta hydrolase [Yinghuangia seranimata]|uniref:alpha/beta hydrolase n=1 Tax=Yinghuangia seranimata TaxID=408067 RepID=UPI00248C1AED|nr:alpha/beta hydrolase [Yinghuangia seranimata]MDI2124891.1 alpha/beta hydrolase [Yinghuangia seranimata]